MQKINPMEIGLVFWAEQNPAALLQQMSDLGLHVGQLGVPPELDLAQARTVWARALEDAGVTATSVVCSYRGEDYADMATVHRTVGFTTEALRVERIERTRDASNFAAALGIDALSCHIGFIPSDPRETLYRDLRDLTRVICDACGEHGQNFALETGQESAEVLLGFIAAVDRENLKVNFDPANMIIYGSGDPLAALQSLSPHVLSFHCKDARASASGNGKMGTECTLGDGDVDFPAILGELRKMNYRNTLSIEREESDAARRIADIKTAIQRLQQWMANL